MGFHFRPVFKSDNTQKKSSLRKKTAQIIDDLKRALLGEWQNISDTAMRAAIRTSREGWLPLWRPAAAISSVMACDSDFLWLFRILFLMTLRLYRAIFVELRALFPEILRFEFVTLFMRHPCKYRVGRKKMFGTLGLYCNWAAPRRTVKFGWYSATTHSY